MSQQLPLGLQLRTPASLQDFVYADNAPLATLLKAQLQANGEPLIYLHGEIGSGRTHLLTAQCAEAQTGNLAVAYLPCTELTQLAPEMLQGLDQLDLVAIDDVEALAGQSNWERALFNLFNRARDQGCRLLIAGAMTTRQLPLQLADLRSRLSWGVSYRMKPLDDSQRRQLVKQMAARRGLEMPDEVARYVIERYQRDSHALNRLIDRLDIDSLAEQRRLSIPFVRIRLEDGSTR